jgi:tctex1 domain-containing protein 2
MKSKSHQEHEEEVLLSLSPSGSVVIIPCMLRFYPSKAKIVIDRVLKEELEEQVYDEDNARLQSLRISDLIREGIQEMLWNTRYKIIVQTTIGQLRDQGISVASRCLWDPNFDNYASSDFKNVSILQSFDSSSYSNADYEIGIAVL